jgi:very-short-patch-repair endonuclease
VKIICPDHGEFEQTPSTHLRGQGCPKCRESKGERQIRLWLEKHSITYEPQKRFDNCRSARPLPFDFFLPNYNMCIEYDGELHFKNVVENGACINKHYFTKKDWHQQAKHDAIKTQFCLKKGIRLLRIAYTQDVEEILNITVKQFGKRLNENKN